MPKRLLNIQSGHNFRDLGGYQTVDGHRIKWRRLLRTGSLATLNVTDRQKLTKIPVSLDLDLRAPAEAQQAPDLLPTGAHYYHLPVFAEDETDASHSDEEIAQQMRKPGNGYRHMLEVYRRMATIPSAKQAYQQMFKLLANNQTGAAIFHCTAGKDRTGMAAFLVLSALGVPRETIFKDYLLTNTITASFREQRLKELRNQLPQTPTTDILINNRRALASVNHDYLATALHIINQRFGSVQRYLRDYLEVSPEELEQMHQLYLEKA